jgi:hypothetical protein
MKANHKLVCFLSACLSLSSLGGCGSQGSPPTTTVTTPAEDKGGYTLDVLIQSPLAIVQYKSGEIEALLPTVDQHTYGYVKALNDCGISDNTPAKDRDYQLSFTLTPSSTNIDPNHTIPDEVRIDNAKETVKIDPAKKRFAKIALPTPREIVPIHLDDEGLTIFKKGGSKPMDHQYPTLIALRYTVPADPVVSLKNSSTSCPLKMEKLGKEMLVRVGMGPAVEDSDNDIHKHAKLAFAAERDLLEGLDRDIDYIKLQDEPSVAMDVKHARRHRTSDCQAPILLVTNAD